jgi:MFS family permease
MLLFGGAIAYVDRATLSIANPLIRKEMGLSVGDMGLLLSAFLWAYAVAQLPAGGLVDRLKPRRALGLGLVLWSIAQMLGGLVGNFWQFVLARIILGLGESPQYVTGTRVARDWFHAKDRGLATGIFISASALGTAISAPMLTALMLAFGWRWMFGIMGIAGIVLGTVWLTLYRDPDKANLTAEESAYLVAGDGPAPARAEGSLREWGRMFRFRTTWGVVAGHFGEVYMIWLYTAWLPGYLEMERHMSIKTTGWVAAIPFIAATVGGLWGGWFGDVLVRRGWSPIDSRRYPLTISLLLVGVFTAWAAFIESNTAAVALISISMLLNQIASTNVWSIVSVASPKKFTASFAGISNCGGYVGAALAPTVTGFIVQATGSFVPALLVGSAVAVVGAVLFFVLITVPLSDADLADAMVA